MAPRSLGDTQSLVDHSNEPPTVILTPARDVDATSWRSRISAPMLPSQAAADSKWRQGGQDWQDGGAGGWSQIPNKLVNCKERTGEPIRSGDADTTRAAAKARVVNGFSGRRFGTNGETIDTTLLIMEGTTEAVDGTL